MANFCLPSDRVNSLVTAFKSGDITPDSLAKMPSADRHAFLEQHVGPDAAMKVNSEFESKMLLKNQQQGYITWAKNVTGLKPETRRDLITKIQRLDKVLDPRTEDDFLSDLAETRLGFNVSRGEAKTIANYSKQVDDAISKRNPDGTWKSHEDKMQYGYAVEDMTEYVADLKRNADKLTLGDLKTARGIGGATIKGAGTLKSLSASLDNSSIFRQGWKALWTNPKIWRQNAAQTFMTQARVVGGKNVLREVNAEIVSRPTYDKMAKAGLAIKNPEEAFPESLPGRIPGLGRLYQASEQAYTGFVYKTRADVFDLYLKAAEAGGVNINDKTELQAIAKVVNSLTGRGNLGKAEPVATGFNNLFFSPRFVKSNIDVLTQPLGAGGASTKFARKQAARNLVKIVTGTSAVLGTAAALSPGSVDLDPRSTDFGKIKVGNSRFDVTGGMGSLVTLASRLATGQSKSSTGKITDLRSTDFGSRDQIDVFTDFVRNKLSPAASLAVSSFTGRTSLGEKTNLPQELGKAVTPIGFQNAYETLKDPNSANDLAVIIADGLGISTNTYSATSKYGGDSWGESKSKELQQFKDRIGETGFKEANEQYDQEYAQFVSDITKNPAYGSLSNDDKDRVLTAKKDAIKSSIFEQYNFKY